MLPAFLDQVAERIPQPESVDEVERLCRAVLATLARSVSSGQLAELAVGLPPELRPEFDHGAGQSAALNRRQFLDRVSGHISAVDLDAVEQQTRAVLSTLVAWAPPGEIDDTLAQLPAGLRELFSTTQERQA
jgi:uncharacterized protein (DUF2267 family)